MDNKTEERFERVMTSSAPDLLNDLLKQPITKTENEDELFSELYPRSKRKNKIKWVTAITAIAAAIVIAFLFIPKKSVEPAGFFFFCGWVGSNQTNHILFKRED